MKTNSNSNRTRLETAINIIRDLITAMPLDAWNERKKIMDIRGLGLRQQMRPNR